ncbi:MAG TPA: DUF1697 domain-containing protein [Solirubrobacteraceae bacterium]
MRQIVLLRGINLGPTRRVPMADLRELLSDAGYEDVRTYVQSGNIVLSSDATPAQLEDQCAKLISERFGFEVPVVVRTRDELAKVVAANPLQAFADNPKRYQVSFLHKRLDPETAERVRGLAVEPEKLVIDGREIYAWHPAGVARSKLWNGLAGKGLGVTVTARNWTTVTTLLTMADE